MLNLKHVNALLQTFREARTEEELFAALIKATEVLGFSQVAMGRHVDLGSPPHGAIRLTNYNQDWIAHGMDRDYFADDPIHLASTKTVNGFLWQEVDQIINLTARHKQVLAEAVGFGLGAGFTVPVHLPGEYHGTCSFAASNLDQLHENALPIAQLCGTFAFEAARQFPFGITSCQIDPFARQFLWREGKDFNHGTGHGVGNFLNIHEGPSIHRNVDFPTVGPMEANMIVSNEPAFYSEGDFGVRIESHMVTLPSRHNGYLTFETISRLPLDPQLIDFLLLMASEKDGLREYHEKILSDYTGCFDLETAHWLERRVVAFARSRSAGD